MENVLKYYEFDKKFEVHIDTSSFVVGNVLMQDGHPMTYENQKVNFR